MSLIAVSMLKLNKIKLKNYRNYSDREFEFHKSIVFILGDNAQGKSNLLEAISSISFGALLKAEQERPKVNFQAEYFEIQGEYKLNTRDYTYKYRGGTLEYRNILLNKVEYKNTKEIREYLLKTIIFKAKESLDIIRSSPSVRRNWLDIAIALVNTPYIDYLKKYNKALEQKNKLLRQNQERQISGIDEQLDIWDQQIADTGIFIINARQRILREILESTQNIYASIAGQEENIEIQYKPSFTVYNSPDNILELLRETRQKDKYRGVSSLGIQKDDFEFYINNREAKLYGSQGQQRSVALALHLAHVNHWTEYLEYSPVLLLDDVCAELDIHRQKALFENLPENSQIFITTTHLINLPSIPADKYQIIQL